MGLSDEKYILFTTYKRDGTAVATPVWVVGLADGRLGFITGGTSGKVKRLAHTPRVVVQPCDMRGRVAAGAATAEGTAAVVTEGPDLAALEAARKAKYGFQATLTELMTKVRGLFGRGGTTCGVLIELPGAG